MGNDEKQGPKKDLLSVICHDLKDPLASIVMGAGFLKKVLPQDESMAAARRVTEAIHRSAERMNQVIGDFYDLGKLEAGELTVETRPHDAAAMAHAAFDLFLSRAKEKGLSLEQQISETPMSVTCDRARVVQVFSKLIANAIKFTPEGGSIVLKVEPREGGKVWFAVSDTGRGVPEARKPHVFDREANQRQTPRDGPGLGLAIAKGLVALHGGEIGLLDNDPAGTTVWFTIPVEARSR